MPISEDEVRQVAARHPGAAALLDLVDAESVDELEAVAADIASRMRDQAKSYQPTTPSPAEEASAAELEKRVKAAVKGRDMAGYLAARKEQVFGPPEVVEQPVADPDPQFKRFSDFMKTAKPRMGKTERPPGTPPPEQTEDIVW